MTDLIWQLLSPFLPYIAGALGILATLIFGRRQGRKAEQAKQAARDAKAFRQTTKDVSNETLSADPVDDIRDRLRERGRKP